MQDLVSQCALENKQINDSKLIKYDKCSQNRLGNKIFAEISPLELKERDVSVKCNTHYDVLRDSINSPIRFEGSSSLPDGPRVLINWLDRGSITFDNQSQKELD